MLNPIWRRCLRHVSSARTGGSPVADAPRSPNPSPTRNPIRADRRFRARLEELESRLAPASFLVNAQLEVSRLENLGDTPVEGSGVSPPVTHAVVFFESAVADYQV